ncbi:MAG TPA: ABC transporter permease [Candidatus Limnocylindria bacterium]|nr:ABC transporter permease [Candidatus Limnocylindria bacterium]
MKRLGVLLRRAVVPALALVTAFFLGAILIVLTDYEHLQNLGSDPVGAIAAAIGGVFEGYGAMLSGAIGDPGRIVAAIQSGNPIDVANAVRPLTETLVGATPFIFVALGLVVSFRAGLFNLGADGQFLIGGLGTVITANLLHGLLPPFAILGVALAGGTLFGAAYGFVPGFLKARTGAHEVITTLMLNSIAPGIMVLVLRSGDFSRSLSSIADVPLLFDLQAIRLDWGFVFALLMAPVVSFLLSRTSLGFELRATGFSRTAARGAGMSPGRSTVLAMVLSGGLVGMGSAFLALGPARGLSGGPFDLGYVALALALLGGLRPSGVVLVALLYGALTNGAKNMVIVTGIPLALLVVIIALAMMFVAAPGLTRSIWRLGPARQAPELAPIQPTGHAEGI